MDELIPVVRASAVELYRIELVNGAAVLASGAPVLDSSLVWIQGVVVEANADGSVILDDGTGVVLCVAACGTLDVVHRGGIRGVVRVGNYIAVKGELQLHSLSVSDGSVSTVELRNCGFACLEDPNLETLWFLEMAGSEVR